MMDEQKESLMSKHHRPSVDLTVEGGLNQQWPACSRCSSRSKKYLASVIFSTTYLIILHIACLFLGAYTICIWIPGLATHEDQLLDYDRRYPDWVPISYELHREDEMSAGASKYAGLPNESNTKAWDDLIIPTFFSASLEDLQKTGESIDDSVRLAQGGYIAGLAVYHNIHCIRRLRLFLHSDYYYRNLTEANMEYLRGHLGHCIESLRRTIMCNVDTTLYTFTWADAEMIKPGIYRPRPKSRQEKKCVNWEAVETWAMERRVELNPVLLKPSGEEEKILMI
ncbi:protein of unknown function (DUF3328) domain containing protein [Naviculisporaceae sp. PSN 640]